MSNPLTVVVGEDDVLLREGIVRLLGEAGFEVVAQAGDAADLLRKGLAHHPSVVIADVNMPPGHGDDGLRAAIEIRKQRPKTGVLVLSQYYEEQYAIDLIGARAEGVGYLLKERVGDLESFIDAVNRVGSGGSALDPEVVGRMLGRRQRDHPLDRLSPREADVLAAMAEGTDEYSRYWHTYKTRRAVSSCPPPAAAHVHACPPRPGSPVQSGHSARRRDPEDPRALCRARFEPRRCHHRGPLPQACPPQLAL
jgi:DNA-binding NarL/FixJ family response regulator